MGILLVAGLGSATACDAAGPGHQIPTHEVRDSGGVEIVRAGTPSGVAPDTWALSPTPTLEIGTVEGAAAYSFTDVRDALWLPGGGVVVSEGMTREIRVFHPDGSLRAVFGGAGPGPTEFGGPPWPALRAPDTLVVWDPGHARQSWFTVEGALLRQRSLRPVVDQLHAAYSLMRAVPGYVWQVAPDGGLLLRGSVAGTRREGVYAKTQWFVFLDSATTAAFGPYPAGEQYEVAGIALSNPLAPMSHGVLGRSGLPVGISHPERREIRFYAASGELRRILRVPLARIPANDSIRSVRLRSLTSWVSAFRLPPGTARTAANTMTTPDSLPAISALYDDGAGHLWVGRRTAEPEVTEAFDVFDAEGHWVATATIPRNLGRLVRVERDRALFEWRNELGVPFLRVHAIRRPGTE